MWRPALALELARWRRARRTARLWWRDDDATGSAPPADRAKLDRLLEASWAAATPLTLAVVPTGDLSWLAARLAGAELATVAQHGVDHRNRREGPAAGEFPRDWSRERLGTELAWGWARIEALPRAAGVFMPPWNDVHPQLPAALAAQAYGALSAYGALPDGSGPLPRIDAHLDLLRWRGGARFRGPGKFLSALTDELARRRLAGQWAAPIGLLTHHLVHDAAAWDFLAAFLAWSRARPELVWMALPDLLAEVAVEAPAAWPTIRQPIRAVG